MTNTNVHSIQTSSGRKPPDGTQLKLINPGVAQYVQLELKLPGQPNWVDLGLIKVEEGVIRFPLPLAFLCHASDDEDSVRSVGDRLQSDGIVTWFAPTSLRGGAKWKDEIERAIADADFVVMFLSRAAVEKTGYFQKEIRLAFEELDLKPDSRRYVIPVLLEHCEPPKRFQDIHWIKLFDDDGYDRLKAALR